MGRRALSCSVTIDIQTVSSTETCLPHRGDVYLRISLFGRVGRTCALRPDFPLRFYESFHFEKIFQSAFEPTQLTCLLQNSEMSVKLLQVTPSCGHNRGTDIELAAFHSTAMSFLYPLPTKDRYGGDCIERPRTMVLCRTCNFPGVNAQLTFQTCTVIKEVTVQSTRRDTSMCEKVGFGKKRMRTVVRQPMASRVVRFTRPPWDISQPNQCTSQPDRLAACGCTQRRATASLKPYRKQTRHQSLRAVKRCSPRRTVPCNSPSSDDARDFYDEFCCEPDPCDPCPSVAETTRGFSRRSSRRTCSAPPTRRPRARCASPVDFECGFLRQKSDRDCDCTDSEPRPPFVVRRVDSKMLHRIPGLPGGSRRKSGKKRRSRAFQLCDCCKDIQVERAPQFVERCTVCDTYEKYMGKPYWGHQNGCHPVGLKQVPVEVTRCVADGLHKYNASYYGESSADEFRGISSQQFGRTDRLPAYNSSHYADAPTAMSESCDDLTERIEQALRISSSGLSANVNTDQSLSEPRTTGYRAADKRTGDNSSSYRGAW